MPISVSLSRIPIDKYFTELSSTIVPAIFTVVPYSVGASIFAFPGVFKINKGAVLSIVTEIDEVPLTRLASS